MITLEEAKALEPGDIIHDTFGRRWKVTGKVKTWKKDPTRIRVPLKFGLYAYGALQGYMFDKDGKNSEFTKGEPPPKKK